MGKKNRMQKKEEQYWSDNDDNKYVLKIEKEDYNDSDESSEEQEEISPNDEQPTRKRNKKKRRKQARLLKEKEETDGNKEDKQENKEVLRKESKHNPKEMSKADNNDEILNGKGDVLKSKGEDEPEQLLRKTKKEKKQDMIKKKIEEEIEVLKENTRLKSSFIDNNSDENNISFGSVSITAHGKYLLVDSPFHTTYGHRYGLIGKNGIGKSSLLKQISGRDIPIHSNMTVYYMEQDIILSDDSVLNTVLMSNNNRYELIKEYNRLSKIMEDDNADVNMDIITHYNKIGEELYNIGADKDEAIVVKILLGLGFRKEEIFQPNKLLSGGWRMRVALAKALYLEPTLLLLDEPTNHLDINATLWLTNYLRYWKKTLIVVSHNQHFLNEVCSDIINIQSKKLVYYKGNYFKFKRMIQQQRDKMESDWEKLQKEIKAIRRKKNMSKKEEEEIIEHMQKIKDVSKPEKEYNVNIVFPNPPDLGHPILETHDVYFEYISKHPIIKHMDMGIDMNTRMTIVGANGNGKTTIMNLLIGLLSPTKGDIKRHSALKIGYYNQHFVDTLPLESNGITYLQSLNQELTKQEGHKYLGSIGLESYAHTIPISNLSGGQKARIVLASIQLQKPHLLFLDEPTNHLDIETVDALINGINNFKGGVIIISHDMELITQTNCRLWVCEDGFINEFKGDYDDYYQYILQDIVDMD